MIVRTESPGDVRLTPLGELTVKDVKILRYPTGSFFVQYLYEDLLDKWVEDMRKNLANGFDNMSIFEGGEGCGKSTLVYQASLRYDPNFDLEKRYMYDFYAMMAKVKESSGDDSDKQSIFWLDEAVNVANKRRWQSEQNVNFTDLLIMMRSRGWCVNMCIPRKDDLDFYIRDYRFRYQATVSPMSFPICGYKQRGYFELRRKNPDTGILEYVGIGEYDDLPQDLKEKYEKIKAESQRRKITEITDNDSKGYRKKYEEERAKIGSAILALHNSGVDREHIKQLFGIESDNTYYSTLKRARDKQK